MTGNKGYERPAVCRGGITNNAQRDFNKRGDFKQGQKFSRLSGKFIDFKALKERLNPHLPTLVCHRLLPGGRRRDHEWVALNPTRTDSREGSFKVNLVTGRWADFATGDRGGDIISLWAYIKNRGSFLSDGVFHCFIA